MSIYVMQFLEAQLMSCIPSNHKCIYFVLNFSYVGFINPLALWANFYIHIFYFPETHCYDP